MYGGILTDLWDFRDRARASAALGTTLYGLICPQNMQLLIILVAYSDQFLVRRVVDGCRKELLGDGHVGFP